MMEMNLRIAEDLMQLSKLSAQLKDEEKKWAELYMKRRRAEESGSEPHAIRRYSDMIDAANGRIAVIKNVIVEHVHVLAARTDAQLKAEGAAWAED